MSLIEVTIVILIIGVLAAVAAPRFSDTFRGIQLEAAALRLAADIDFVRNTAINESRDVTIVFDNDRSSYQSNDVDSPERPGERLQVSLPLVYDDSVSLVADFDTTSTLTFDYEGVPHAAGAQMVSGQITLRSGSHQFVVTIATGSGRTTVSRSAVFSPSPHTIELVAAPVGKNRVIASEGTT